MEGFHCECNLSYPLVSSFLAVTWYLFTDQDALELMHLRTFVNIPNFTLDWWPFILSRWEAENAALLDADLAP